MSILAFLFGPPQSRADSNRALIVTLKKQIKSRTGHLEAVRERTSLKNRELAYLTDKATSIEKELDELDTNLLTAQAELEMFERKFTHPEIIRVGT